MAFGAGSQINVPIAILIWLMITPMIVPVVLIAKQPDLGTSILVFAAGFYVLFFAGFSWRIILPAVLVGAVSDIRKSLLPAVAGAYGLRDEEYLKLKILTTGLPELQNQPNLTHGFAR